MPYVYLLNVLVDMGYDMIHIRDVTEPGSALLLIHDEQTCVLKRFELWLNDCALTEYGRQHRCRVQIDLR